MHDYYIVSVSIVSGDDGWQVRDADGKEKGAKTDPCWTPFLRRHNLLWNTLVTGGKCEVQSRSARNFYHKTTSVTTTSHHKKFAASSLHTLITNTVDILHNLLYLQHKKYSKLHCIQKHMLCS